MRAGCQFERNQKLSRQANPHATAAAAAAAACCCLLLPVAACWPTLLLAFANYATGKDQLLFLATLLQGARSLQLPPVAPLQVPSCKLQLPVATLALDLHANTGVHCAPAVAKNEPLNSRRQLQSAWQLWQMPKSRALTQQQQQEQQQQQQQYPQHMGVLLGGVWAAHIWLSICNCAGYTSGRCNSIRLICQQLPSVRQHLANS